MMFELGKTIIILGIVLIAVGLLMVFFGKIPFIGKLPGDILVKREHLTFYFPLATSLVISIIVSLLLWLFQRR